MKIKMERNDTPDAPALLARLAPLILATEIGLGLLLSWGTWPDVQIDFGREWYVPQQLSRGAVLYRDLAYFNGPFSPSLNAALFRCCGARLLTLVLFNALWLWLFAVVLFRLLARLSSPAAALVAVSLTLALCGFSQYLDVGNSNWICPYSHEITHGIVLGLLAFWFADRWTGSRRTIDLALCGFFCGLVLLTKCEVALAAGGGVSVLLAGSLFFAGPGTRLPSSAWCSRETLRSLTVLLTAAAIPVLAAVALQSRHQPLSEAILAVAGSWKYLLRPELTQNDYYRAVMGTDDPAASLRQIYAWTVLWIAVSGVSLLIGQLGISKRSPVAGSLLAALVIGGALTAFQSQLNWLSFARPWPVLLLLAAGWSLFRWRHLPPEARRDELLRLSLMVWSGLLLLKILLYCRIFHYGFALAAPALAIVVCAAWNGIPVEAEKRLRASAPVVRAGLMALLLVGTVWYGNLAAEKRALHQIRVTGVSGDSILADSRGELVNRLLEELRQRLRPEETLLCLPEGVMLNVLSGHATGGRFLNFVPADMQIFREEEMLRNLQAFPPDWIIYWNRNTSEYGPAKFGVDYGREIGNWIAARYDPVTSAGGEYMSSDPGYRVLQGAARSP